MEVDNGRVVTDEGIMYNSTDRENQPFEFSNYTHRVIVATMLLLVSLLGTFGNTLVILAVLLSKKVRTATNALVVNLSVADLLTCLAIPWDAVALLSKDGLPFPEWVCSTAAVALNSSIGCSIITLASIGLNRLLLITRPTASYRRMYTPKKVAVGLVVSWMVPLIITVLPSIIKVGDLTYDPKYHLCGASSSHPRSTFFAVLVGGILYPGLLITIIVSYVLIWRYLTRHTKMILSSREEPSEPTISEATTASTSVDSGGVPMHMTAAANPSTVTAARPSIVRATRSSTVTATRSSTVKAARPNQLSRRQTEITKNMFYIVCAFLLCFTPYIVVVFLGNREVRPYFYSVLVFNSCVNPMIYATKHRDFRAIFGRIVRRQWGSIPEPSGFLKALRRSK